MENTSVGPGSDLRDAIKRVFEKRIEQSFLSKIDECIGADGDFVDLVYQSSINYLTRRVIRTALYIETKAKSAGRSEDQIITETRAMIRSLLNSEPYPSYKEYDLEVEKILFLARDCVIAIARDLSSGLKNQVRRSAQSKARQPKCYICGTPLDFTTSGNANSAEVEHIWPQSLGGAAAEHNLAIACRECNQRKQSYLDHADFHYEHFVISKDEGDSGFAEEFKREYKIALWARNNYCCSMCDAPASQMGRLSFLKRDESDTWHMLNVDVYCDRCEKRLRRA